MDCTSTATIAPVETTRRPALDRRKLETAIEQVREFSPDFHTWSPTVLSYVLAFAYNCVGLSADECAMELARVLRETRTT